MQKRKGKRRRDEGRSSGGGADGDGGGASVCRGEGAASESRRGPRRLHGRAVTVGQHGRRKRIGHEGDQRRVGTTLPRTGRRPARTPPGGWERAERLQEQGRAGREGVDLDLARGGPVALRGRQKSSRRRARAFHEAVACGAAGVPLADSWRFRRGWACQLAFPRIQKRRRCRAAPERARKAVPSYRTRAALSRARPSTQRAFVGQPGQPFQRRLARRDLRALRGRRRVRCGPRVLDAPAFAGIRLSERDRRREEAIVREQQRAMCAGGRRDARRSGISSNGRPRGTSTSEGRGGPTAVSVARGGRGGKVKGGRARGTRCAPRPAARVSTCGASERQIATAAG